MLDLDDIADELEFCETEAELNALLKNTSFEDFADALFKLHKNDLRRIEFLKSEYPEWMKIIPHPYT